MKHLTEIDRHLIEHAILLARHAADDLTRSPGRKPRAQQLQHAIARLADIQSTLGVVLS